MWLKRGSVQVAWSSVHHHLLGSYNFPFSTAVGALHKFDIFFMRFSSILIK
jgi:hypothetical protein